MKRAWILLLLTVAACAPATGPVVREGLWRQTIALTGTELNPDEPPAPVVSLICVGKGGHIRMPYYRANSGRSCSEDTFSGGPGGSWVSRTICEHATLGTMTVTAEVGGDFTSQYMVTAHVGLKDSETDAQVLGQFQGPCPAGMRPGEERPVQG